MNKIILTFAFILALTGSAEASYTPPGAGGGVPAGTTGQLQYNNAGAFGAAGTVGSTPSSNIWSLITSASNLCSAIPSIQGDLCTAFFGWANPIGYNGFCDSNTNNNTHDDSPAIQAAGLNSSHAPVNVGPTLFCKLASKVTLTRLGEVFFTFARSAAYNDTASGSHGPSSPYLFVTDNLTSSLVFDTQLHDDTGFFNLLGYQNTPNGLKGNAFIGESATSFPDGGSASFMDVENVSTANVAVLVGYPTGSTFGSNICVSTTPSAGQLIQLYFNNIHAGQGCFTLMGNITDILGDRLTSTDNSGNCIAPGPSAGIQGTISNIRCEFTGFVPSGQTAINHSAGIVGSPAALNLLNLQEDHIIGTGIYAPANTQYLSVIGGMIYNSNFGGSQTGNYDAQITIEAGASNLYFVGLGAQNNTGHPSYGISTTGNIDYLTFRPMGQASNWGTVATSNFAGTVSHMDYCVLGDKCIINGQTFGVGIGTGTPVSGTTFQVGGDIDLAARSYINFGSTDGISGYGVRDNGGIIQSKNSGGVWSQIVGTISIPGGLSISNDITTPNTVLDTASGSAIDDTQSVVISLPAITKTTGAWTAGSGNGGLDIGTTLSASSSYTVFGIGTGTSSDELWSLSSINPAMPAGYLYKTRLGSFLTDGSAHILAFSQHGQSFTLNSVVVGTSSVSVGTASVLQTLNFVPTGVKVEPKYAVTISTSSPPTSLLVTSPDEQADVGPTNTIPFSNAQGFSVQQITSAAGSVNTAGPQVITNSLGQIRLRASTAGTAVSINGWGWVDCLGGSCPQAVTTVLTSGTTYTLPGNWNPNNNLVIAIGEGGSGGTSTSGGGGGGGGAYSAIINLADTAGTSEGVQIGTGGTATTTQFKNSGTLVADYGRSAGGSGNGAAGGLTTNSTGTTKFAGGVGGTTGGKIGGGGGGGSGGPYGAGAVGGIPSAFSGGGSGGGGGGGSDGGSTGGTGTSGSTGPGGTGGNGRGGTGGGLGGTGATGSAGTFGGGGGGGGGSHLGGPGGVETLWLGSTGPAGGAGGGGQAGVTSFGGGGGTTCGGGGGGGSGTGTGGTGGGGCIIVIYWPVK